MSLFDEKPPSEWKKRIINVSVTAEQAEEFALIKEKLEDIGDDQGPLAMSDGAVLKRGLSMIARWLRSKGQQVDDIQTIIEKHRPERMLDGIETGRCAGCFYGGPQELHQAVLIVEYISKEMP